MEKKERINVPSWKIFDYWKDKCITEDGDVLITYGYDGCDKSKLDVVESCDVVNDWGEVTCWACNRFFGDMEYFEAKDEKQLWLQTRGGKHLQKCHIRPFSISEDDSVENLFLMCGKCHEESPDVNNPKCFFQWVFERRTKLPGVGRELKEAFDILANKYNIKEPKIDIKQALSRNNISTHRGGLSSSTVVYALVDNAITNQKEQFKMEVEKWLETQNCS